ncbi:MAG: glycine betaine/L-proline ABC transporter ATP-binding protein [bacterium]
MIKVEHIYKIFGEKPQEAIRLVKEGKSKKEIHTETGKVVAVDDVSFEVKEGELFVVMGLSGSGKSTLLRCINRLIEPTSGKVYLKMDNKQLEITSLKKRELREVRKKMVSMVFQSFALFPHRTVLSNVTFGMEVQKKEKKYRREKARQILNMVGLEEWANSYPSHLSGGMQQRVGLSRALATEAKVLLMDEPFSALDPLIRVRMQNEFLKLEDKLQRTIIFVTHDLDEALKLGDRIAIMENGQIVQMGTAEEIILNPKTEYVAKFVENADPSGVITAETIVRTIPECSLPLQKVCKKGEEKLYLIDEERQIYLSVDEEMRPQKAQISGKSLPIRVIGEEDKIAQEGKGGRYLPAVKSKVVLRDIMKIMMGANLPLVLVLSNKSRLKGVITEKPLFQTILKEHPKGSEE